MDLNILLSGLTISEVCDHFIQRELTNDNLWRSLCHKESLQGLFEEVDQSHIGDVCVFPK